MNSKSIPKILAGLILSAPVQAAETMSEWFAHAAERAWLEPYDPTLITRRTYSEFTYENQSQGDELWKIENSFRWAFPLGDDLACAFQALVPVDMQESGGEEIFGFGDLEFRSGLVGRLSPTLRWGAGLNAVFDSASEPALGGDAFVLRPIVALRWDLSDRVNLGFNLEYNFTPTDEADDDVSALELKFPVVVKLAEHWSAAVTYKPRWDFLDESDRHRLEFGATRVFGDKNQFALSLGFELPLTTENFDSKLIAGFAWNF